MAEAMRSPAPPNIGETTLRIVLDHFPGAQRREATGEATFTDDALHMMRMVKGLRAHNAGPETIRRVIHSYVPSRPATGEPAPQPIPIRRAPGVIAQDARAKATDITTAVDAVAGRFDALTTAMDALADSLAAFSTAAETMAPKRNRFDAFLGSLGRLAELSKKQRG